MTNEAKRWNNWNVWNGLVLIVRSNPIHHNHVHGFSPDTHSGTAKLPAWGIDSDSGVVATIAATNQRRKIVLGAVCSRKRNTCTPSEMEAKK